MKEKIKRNINQALNQPQFGLLFDIDGVIARGSTPLPAAIEGLQKLTDGAGNFVVPVAFVTNGCNTSSQKAKAITKWLGIEVIPEQVIHAQSPLKVFNHYHDIHTLFVGQGDIHGMARELGFTNICTIDQIKDAYPLLDMVDHENRKVVAQGYTEKEFPEVEAIVIVGEPDRWESALQLLVDLLVTKGKPDHAPDVICTETQVPILACNMDLVFMAEAVMPRYGNGAFLVCLEGLYKKVTGVDLQYAALIGKPSEITYRYAEHVIAEQAKRLGLQAPIERLYFVGDNPNVDIVGTNIYNQYIQNSHNSNSPVVNGGGINGFTNGSEEAPSSRAIPADADFHEQTVRSIEGLLVGTGVYNPSKSSKKDSSDHSHRDFNVCPSLAKPTKYVDDVHRGIDYVLHKENFPVLCE